MDGFRSRITDLQPDIIAVTEVLPKHSHDKIISVNVQLNGYNMFQNLNSGRGILLYCKSAIHASIEQNLTNHCFNESLWCVIPLAAHGSVFISIIYHSPNSKAENFTHLRQLFTIASRHSSHLLIMGDFHFPSIDWAS